jgi:hypothetical protein
MNITLRQMWKRENPLPQYAFKMSMFNVSAIHINSRSWLRSSSTHEPSDPPLRIVIYLSNRSLKVLKMFWAARRVRENCTGVRWSTTTYSLVGKRLTESTPRLPSDNLSTCSLKLRFTVHKHACRFNRLPRVPLYTQPGETVKTTKRSYPNE